MKAFKKWGLRILLGLGVLYVGICVFMYCMQERFLFHPEAIPEGQALALPEGANEVWMTASDGARIHGIYHHAERSRGVVLFFHGNGGNVERCIPLRERFLPHGYDLFVVDYRGYGKSRGDMSEEGLHADAEAAWNYVDSLYPPDQIVVYGQSMGSGIATMLAARHRPRLLILETPYTALVDVAKGEFPWLPVGLIFKYPMRSVDHIGKVQCPVLVFHGTKDATIPYEMGKEMAGKALKGNLVTLEGAEHAGCANYPEYKAALETHLR